MDIRVKPSKKASTKGMGGGCKEKAGKSMGKIGGEKAGKIKDDRGQGEGVDRIQQEEAAPNQPVSKCFLMAAGEVGMSVQRHVG